MLASSIVRMSAAAVPADVRPPELTEEQLEKILAAAEEAHSASTRRAYAGAWSTFVRWAEAQGLSYFPAAPETVALHLAERAEEGMSRSTLKIARAAIAHMHREAGHADPTANEGCRRVLRGLSRRIADSRGQKQASGLTATHLAAIVATAHLPRSGATGRTESKESAEKRGAVDIAICAVMRDAMLRRSEAAALRWADIELREDGTARVTVRRSKGDQEAEGAVLFVGKAATAALKAIRPTKPDPGARCFGLRTGTSISNRIRAAAKAAGLEGTWSGHSPRVGMTLDLVAAGASLAAVQVAGRWASSRMPALYARGEMAGNGAVAKYYRPD